MLVKSSCQQADLFIGLARQVLSLTGFFLSVLCRYRSRGYARDIGRERYRDATAEGGV